jgi:hypothetical protein
MEYTRVSLKGSLADVLADIKAIVKDGEPAYPEYPDGYEVTGGSIHERFIVTQPRQEVIQSAEFDENENETKAAILGDWSSKLVLPAGYDVSHFNTLNND